MAKKELDLVEQARTELRRNQGEWPRLSKISERRLSYRWLLAFANGEIRDPSARKLIELGKYIGMKIISVPGPHFNKFTAE